jgi:potassium-transporting ATPase KdpC subunit
MKKNFTTAILFTLVTTVLLGLVYPAVVTGLAQAFFRERANGQLVARNGVVIGSRIIAQPFTGPQYFHPRPSVAGTNGYDATNSSGSNLGPTNQKLVDRVKADVATLQAEHPGQSVPVEMVTTSGSGLDPDISPEAARFQMARIAKSRGISEEQLQEFVQAHVLPRQFGFLGESRVNVLELNLALDQSFPVKGSRAK